MPQVRETICVSFRQEFVRLFASRLPGPKVLPIWFLIEKSIAAGVGVRSRKGAAVSLLVFPSPESKRQI